MLAETLQYWFKLCQFREQIYSVTALAISTRALGSILVSSELSKRFFNRFCENDFLGRGDKTAWYLED